MQETPSTPNIPAQNASQASTQPVLPVAQQVVKAPSATMWDAFEHILLFISLFVMATSIALIMHYFVDKWFPGIPTNNYYPSSSSMNNFQLQLLRGYLAGLIVSFPLFAFFFVHITKRTVLDPSIRNIKARKILIYTTLVVTFIIMLYNVISTVFNLLSGNISVNFLLHLFVTFLVSGTIFGYYLLQVKEDRKINA